MRGKVYNPPAREPASTAAWYSELTRDKLQDSLFLGLVVLLSLFLYVDKLGFYMDDWGFLRLLVISNDQSFLGLSQWLYTQDQMVRERPTQALLLAGLYRLFGLQPLGYHLTNSVVICFTAILFYHVLRELNLPRLPALSVPLVYILLPHYSTDRFWIAAFQATLSIPLYLLNLYANLVALKSRAAQLWGWKILGILSLLGSCFAYELTLPLFLLNFVIIGYRARGMGRSEAGERIAKRKQVALLGIDLVVLALVIGYKAATSTRLNVETGLVPHLLGLFGGALRVNYGTYGLGLPYILWWILRNRPDWALFSLAGSFFLLIFSYLFYIASRSLGGLPGTSFWLKLAGLGFIVFGLGYSIFSVNADAWFTSASIGNRLAIAAALGVAASFVGGIGWFSSLFPPSPRQKGLFCLLAALLCMSGFLITNTLARFWSEAYRMQQAVLADIRRHNPVLPSGSILVLDAFCLQHGGAYSLNGSRDLGGALSIAYQDQSLQGAASERSPQVQTDGLAMHVNGKQRFFPYSEKLLVYHYQQKKTTPLTDAETAREYFLHSGFIPERDCPPGFAWGINE